MKYFDAHCHVQFDAYDKDREAVLAAMAEAEVGGLVVGCDFASSKAAVELVAGRENLTAAVGLHPNEVLRQPFDVAAFEELVRAPQVVAIGECGLDFYRPEDVEHAKEKQHEVFEQHIELAVKHDKALVIHSRPSRGSQDAYRETIDILRSKKREYGDRLRGDMHFFVGGVEEARDFVDLGFTMSYTAVITFARDYDEVIRYIPLENLLSETDSPYVAPAPNRGKRNDPLAVRKVVRMLAEIRAESLETVQQAMLQNARQKLRII